jgi:hypothetical protein
MSKARATANVRTTPPTTTANQLLMTMSVRTGSPYAQRAPGGQAESPEELTNLEPWQVASPMAPEWSHTNAPTAIKKHAAPISISRSCTPAT